jgi:hypothetical protein
MNLSDALTYLLVITGLVSFVEVLVFALWKLYELYFITQTWFYISLVAPILCIVSLIGALKA